MRSNILFSGIQIKKCSGLNSFISFLIKKSLNKNTWTSGLHNAIWTKGIANNHEMVILEDKEFHFFNILIWTTWIGNNVCVVT